MAAYIVSRVSIDDAEIMSDYMADAPDTVLKYGGKYLLRTGNFETLEGTADYDRMVVLEFPDKDSALQWYNSEEYMPLRDIRQGASEAHIVVVPDEGAFPL